LIGQFHVGSLTLQITDDKAPVQYENFKVELQKACWRFIFSKMKMGKYLSAKMQEELNKFCEQQTKYPFTVRNVYQMINFIIQTNGERMKTVVLEVFDTLTKNHAENQYIPKGWKTNSHYMINKKIIVPHVVDVEYHEDPRIKYADGRFNNVQVIEDFCKVLCMITGTNYDTLPSLYDHCRYGNDLTRNNKIIRETGTWYEWGFFRYKMFKAGTIHLEFLDKKVWEMLNRTVGELKGFQLPQSF
jgi:hypothetical protein